jgi:hypothetical protein
MVALAVLASLPIEWKSTKKNKDKRESMDATT